MTRPESVDNCGNCRYYFEGECHFASPNPAGLDGLLWPPVAPTKWCGRWKKPSDVLPASLRASDGAILAMMDVAGEIEHDEFVQRVAREFGIHEKSAQVKIQRLLHRGKLDDDEGKITLALLRRKKARGAAADVDAGPRGRPVKNDFLNWRDVLKLPFGNLEDAGTYSELRKIATEHAPISNGSFTHMLGRAMEAGQVIKTPGGKYYVAPLLAPVAPDGIEAP